MQNLFEFEDCGKSDRELLADVDLMAYPHSGTETSRVAAANQDPVKSEKIYLKILGELRLSRKGLSRHELSRLVKLSGDSLRPRLFILAEHELIFKTSDRRMGDNQKIIEVLCHLYNRQHHDHSEPFGHRFVSRKRYDAVLAENAQLHAKIEQLQRNQSAA